MDDLLERPPRIGESSDGERLSLDLLELGDRVPTTQLPQMKSTSGLDFGGVRSSKVKIRSTLFEARKKTADPTSYKKRTKMAESSASERKALREREPLADSGAEAVNRYSAKSPRILGF